VKTRTTGSSRQDPPSLVDGFYAVSMFEKGINGVGIQNLIIVRNAIQNGCDPYFPDKHFELMKNVFKLTLIK